MTLNDMCWLANCQLSIVIFTSYSFTPFVLFSSAVICAGTVPVYLGDSVHLKSVLPHPKAAIFVADFQNNFTALAAYLTYLTTNETAYEEHRQWRYEYNYEKNIANKPILQNSWHCRVCQWVVRGAHNMTKFGPGHAGGSCFMFLYVYFL